MNRGASPLIKLSFDGGGRGARLVYGGGLLEDLAKLLKVKTRDDAIEFLDSCGSLNHSGACGWAEVGARASWSPGEEPEVLIADILGAARGMGEALRAYKLIQDEVPVSRWSECGFSAERNRCPDNLGLGHELYVVSGIGGGRGSSRCSFQAALRDLLDGLVAEGLAGHSVCCIDLTPVIRTDKYSAALWIVFADKLFKGDIRSCNVCGEPFVANTGQANERGSNPKSNCSSACRYLKVRAEKAKKLIALGMETEEAAKTTHISVAKLKRYLELHPIEGEMNLC